MPVNSRVGRPRRTACAAIEATASHCHLCGLPIDMRADRQRHPLAFSVDEVIPFVRGGSTTDPANTRPAHRICNSSRGQQPITPSDPEWLDRTREPAEVKARCQQLARAAMGQAETTTRTW